MRRKNMTGYGNSGYGGGYGGSIGGSPLMRKNSGPYYGAWLGDRYETHETFFVDPIAEAVKDIHLSISKESVGLRGRGNLHVFNDGRPGGLKEISEK